MSEPQTEETLKVRNSFVALIMELESKRVESLARTATYDQDLEFLRQRLRAYEDEHGFTTKWK